MPKYTIQVPDGRTVTAEAPDETTAMKGIQEWHKSNPLDESLMGAVKYGTAGALHGLGSTLKNIADSTGLESDKALAGYANSAGDYFDNPNYKPADAIKADNSEPGPISKFLGRKNYNVDFSQLPRSIAEAAAPVGAGIATGGVSVPLTTMGPMTDQAKAEAPGGKMDNLAKAELGAKIVGTTGLGLIPGARVRAPMTQVGMRGVQEAVQRPLQVGAATGALGAAQTGLQGGDPVEGFVQGAATGTALAGARTPGNVAKAAKYRKFSDPEANAALANRLQTHGAKPLIGKAKADEGAMKATEIDLRKDLEAEYQNAKKSLNQDHEKIIARAKKFQDISKEDVASIAALGNPALTSQVSQARAFALLSNQGHRSNGKFKGGISGFADRLIGGNPLWAAAKAGVLSGGAGAAATAVGSGLNAAGTGGALAALVAKGAPYLGGLYGASRLIDSETGSRFPASSFVKKFADKGQTPSSRPLTPLQGQKKLQAMNAQMRAALGATNPPKAPKAPKPVAAPNPQKLAQAAMQKFNRKIANQQFASGLLKKAQTAAAPATPPSLAALQANASAAKAKYNGMSDKQIADEATRQFVQANPKRNTPKATRYWQGVHDRRTRADALWNLSAKNSPELAKMPELKDLLKHSSRRSDVRDVISAIKAHVPQAANTLDGIWTKQTINSIWKR